MTAGIQVKLHTCSSKRSVLPESGSMSGMTAGIQVKPHTCSSKCLVLPDSGSMSGMTAGNSTAPVTSSSVDLIQSPHSIMNSSPVSSSFNLSWRLGKKKIIIKK